MASLIRVNLTFDPSFKVAAPDSPGSVMSCGQLAECRSLAGVTGPNMRRRASGIRSRTMANARISVCRSSSGSMRPTNTTLGSSGSPCAVGKSSGLTPLYMVRMRACAARLLDWVCHLHCCRHDGRSGGWPGEAARHAGDPVSLIRALAQIMAGRLERSGYQSGCAIATMVLELAPGDEDFSAAP